MKLKHTSDLFVLLYVWPFRPKLIFYRFNNFMQPKSKKNFTEGGGGGGGGQRRDRRFFFLIFLTREREKRVEEHTIRERGRTRDRERERDERRRRNSRKRNAQRCWRQLQQAREVRGRGRRRE